jgi:hypothetical protein
MKLRQDVIAADKVKRYPLETQVEVSGTPPARGIIRVSSFFVLWLIWPCKRNY